MSAIAEIKTYLNNNDCSFANRRILDYCYQTEQLPLIQQAIDNSKKYHATVANNADIETWKVATNQLLHTMQSTTQIIIPPITLLDAKQISKKYKQGNFSMDTIDVQLHSNQILGVVGENGNGKTTLLRCLAGQLQIENGTLAYPFLGKHDYYTLQSEIAFIPQRIPKWFGLLKDNLHFSASINGIKNDSNNTMVDFMLERFNLTAYANLTWNQISSGYRTRFEIARILLQKPKLLILDEPLANLDIKAQQTLLTDLKMLAKQSGQTMGIILSSQQLHEVEKVADDVLMMKLGKQIATKNVLQANDNIVVIELETMATMDEIKSVLNSEASIQFNGGFYTIQTSGTSAQNLLQMLSQHMSITYFRNITHSTKRFF
jgi:ABC-2 type transport system ATP-binding protein